MSNIFYGDPLLTFTPDGGALTIQGGQPKMHQGLENAILISVFSTDWWANSLVPVAQRLQSKMPDLLRGTLSDERINQAIDGLNRSLLWLVTSKIADSIDVSIEVQNVNAAVITIGVVEPSGQKSAYRLNWDAQKGLLT